MSDEEAAVPAGNTVGLNAAQWRLMNVLATRDGRKWRTVTHLRRRYGTSVEDLTGLDTLGFVDVLDKSDTAARLFGYPPGEVGRLALYASRAGLSWVDRNPQNKLLAVLVQDHHGARWNLATALREAGVDELVVVDLVERRVAQVGTAGDREITVDELLSGVENIRDRGWHVRATAAGRLLFQP